MERRTVNSTARMPHRLRNAAVPQTDRARTETAAALLSIHADGARLASASPSPRLCLRGVSRAGGGSEMDDIRVCTHASGRGRRHGDDDGEVHHRAVAGAGVTMHRRRFLQLAGLAAAALPRSAGALDYPTRPVRIVAGFAAGGGVDITARLIGQWLGDRLGQSFVTENRPGAGGNIGTEAVVNAVADGYTLLLATVPNAVNAALYPKLNFNFIRDIAPVGGIIRVPMIIMVHPSLPAKTVPELIAYARANPGKITMASAGNGSAPHMAGELFKMMAGVNMLHVPYRGQGPAMTDLLSGEVQLLFAT